MRSLRKTSIQRKLTVVIVCTSLVGLSLACVAFDIYERSSFRMAMTSELSALADTLGANSAAALTFNDRKSAQDTLGALRAERHVVAASLYDSRGAIFAEYRRGGAQTRLRLPEWRQDGAQFGAEYLTLNRAIYLGQDQVGGIAIVSDLGALQAKMRQYTQISLVVLLLSTLVTLLLSSRLLRPITEPILQLAELASRVSEREDYTLRARARDADEVGMLVGSFNQMLERIQERDAALQHANDDLESRVQARTNELRTQIDERKRAEETLANERILLRALIDNVPDFMYVKDMDCKFVVANLAVARQMGASSTAELIGKSDFDFYPRELATPFYEDERRVLLSGRAEINREEVGVDPQGNVSHVMTTQVPVRDSSGRVTGLVGVGRDITHLKKAQAEMQTARDAAEAASRAKSEFLANMSHEIRTPLNGVMGMTELALGTELTVEQREYLETVKMSSDALLTVINDILDFSKIEAGKIELESLDFNLHECMEATLKTLAVRAHERGLELLCEVAPGAPEMARGDASRLRQVFINLIGNAIKFTSAGEVVLKVQPISVEGAEQVVQFTVSDTGVGIPKEKLGEIFEPFTQADTSTTRKFGGTGLGLTISTRLVEMMRGKIWVESEVGRGSQFHFTARLGVVEGRGAVASANALATLAGAKVLVVDDNSTNRRILAVMLSRWGMTPHCEEGGEAALAELSAAREAGMPYRLILTDRQMPAMDGFSFIERVRERPELSAATIVMLTSAGHRGDAARCQELGVAGYLLKPIRQTELREAIGRVLGVVEPANGSPLVTRFSVQGASEGAASLRVLLAEDNAVNQRLAMRLLEKRGHAVRVANNGREALEALEREQFDLVLMDVQMPAMDGFEATAAIREKEKGGAWRQPVIALTAHAMKGDREKCLAAGMDGYLTKPILPQELDELLSGYVRSRREAANMQEAADPGQ
jgi:PAS domain S-box-containing protein